ncbi:MAG: aminotransferase class IV [bacterium]
MINFNGKLQSDALSISPLNRAFNYGDAVFETLKVVNGKPLYFEDHYFRLMASMRILRMEIPMSFTQEFLELEIEKLIDGIGQVGASSRFKIVVFRNDGGYYLPKDQNVSYVITYGGELEKMYSNTFGSYEVGLYKDFTLAPHLLSTLKTTNKSINVLSSIFANENGFEDCLLMNTSKMIVESSKGNIFLVNGNTVKTPPLTDGCLNGILRKQLIQIIQKEDSLEFEESSISPFELQKADEIFITNVIQGITSVTKYKKKNYGNRIGQELTSKLNSLI